MVIDQYICIPCFNITVNKIALFLYWKIMTKWYIRVRLKQRNLWVQYFCKKYWKAVGNFIVSSHGNGFRIAPSYTVALSVSRIITPTLWRKIRPIKSAVWKETEVMANQWRRPCLRRVRVVNVWAPPCLHGWLTTFVKLTAIGLRNVTRKVKFRAMSIGKEYQLCSP